MAYNSQGALNGLFAPAYIKGNPESEAAVSAWNANRQAQLRPAPPPVTPPTTPVTPPVTPSGLQNWFGRLPPELQQRLGPRFGMPASPAGGSFTFTDPTAPPPPPPPAGGGSFTFTEPTLPSAQQPGATTGGVGQMRNNITQALMNRRM